MHLYLHWRQEVDDLCLPLLNLHVNEFHLSIPEHILYALIILFPILIS